MITTNITILHYYIIIILITNIIINITTIINIINITSENLFWEQVRVRQVRRVETANSEHLEESYQRPSLHEDQENDDADQYYHIINNEGDEDYVIVIGCDDQDEEAYLDHEVFRQRLRWVHPFHLRDNQEDSSSLREDF